MFHHFLAATYFGLKPILAHFSRHLLCSKYSPYLVCQELGSNPRPHSERCQRITWFRSWTWTQLQYWKLESHVSWDERLHDAEAKHRSKEGCDRGLANFSRTSRLDWSSLKTNVLLLLKERQQLLVKSCLCIHTRIRAFQIILLFHMPLADLFSSFSDYQLMYQ